MTTASSQTLRVLGISGSLRAKSYNTSALRAAVELKPEDMEIDIADISNLPLYNDDLRLAGYPEPVQSFRSKVLAADAILFVTPEYNYSIPGVLKNAIDWASRPPDQGFDGKPVAIMGATMGALGTARAQYHLRQMLVFLNAFPLNKPEVMIAAAATKFDETGRLTDQITRDVIGQLLVSLATWTKRLKTSAP